LSNVEMGLGVTHAALYRNHPDQTQWFEEQVADRGEATVTGHLEEKAALPGSEARTPTSASK
jgi:hypothetical protein